MNARKMKGLLATKNRLADITLYNERIKPAPGGRYRTFARCTLERDELTPMGNKVVEVLVDFGFPEDHRLIIYPRPGGISIAYGDMYRRPIPLPEMRVARDQLIDLGYECTEIVGVGDWLWIDIT